MVRIRFLLPFLYVVLLLSVTGSALFAAENVKYFWNVEIDQSHAIIGYHPVDAKLIGKVRCCRVTYDKQGRVTMLEYLGAGRASFDNSSGASMVKIEYQDGFERRSYLNSFGRSMTCNGGFNSERIKMDKESHKGSLFVYDEFGNLTADQSGAARYQWDLDDKGFIIKEIKMDVEGERVANNEGVYEERYKLDDKERLIEQRYFGKDGQLIADQNGVAIKKLKWDGGHNVLELQSFGPDELLLGRKSVATADFIWDDRDNRIEAKYFDDNGKLLRIIKNTFDANGNLTEKQLFDDVDKPRAEGVAKTTYTFDAQNHITRLTIFDKDGKKMNDDDLTCEVVYSYDDKGNLVDRKYLKADGTPGIDKSEGYATKHMIYESRGHSIQDHYLDESGKPIMLEAGYSIERRKFNDAGDEIEATYFDREDRPVELKDGVQRTAWLYDATGKTTDVHNYDATGREINLDSLRNATPAASDASTSVIGSMSVLKSTEGGYVFKYNNSLWEQSKEQNSAKPDFALSHRSGSSFALIFHHESEDAPADVLKSLMSDYEGSMKDVSLVRKEYKSVNNHDALYAQIQANINDVPFIIVQYIFRTKTGHVIILCGAPKTSFDKLEQEMMGLLNGMTITE